MRKNPEIPQEVFFEEERPQAVKQSSSFAVKQSNGQKVQVTVYLSVETAKELERARFELLTKHNVRAAKSAIADYAIARAAADVDALAQALRREG